MLTPIKKNIHPGNPARIICLCEFEAWMHAVKKLEGIGLVETLYAVGPPYYADRFQKLFPKTPYHNIYQAIRGIPHDDFVEYAHGAFTANCQKVWIEYAQMLYDFVMRLDEKSFDMTFHEMQCVFYNYLIYWNAMLDVLQPDLVVSDVIPHAGFDAVTYELCKLKGIPYLTMALVTTDSIPYNMPVDAHERLFTPEMMADLHRMPVNPRFDEEEARRRIDKMFLRVDRNASVKLSPIEIPANSAQCVARALPKLRPLPKTLIKDCLECLGLYEYKDNLPESVYYKQKGKTVRKSFRGAFAHSLYLLQRFTNDIKKLRQAILYEEMVQAPPLQGPYIYFPLNSQPEASSNPCGGIFTFQLLIANMLAHNLPEGWSLYVKEHPAQFYTTAASSGIARSREFYAALRELPHTFLLPVNTNALECIQNAKAVVTIVGTAGMEALMSNVPCLLLGNPIYAALQGVIPIRNVSDIAGAIRRVEQGVAVAKREEIYAYFLRLMRHEQRYAVWDHKALHFEELNDTHVASFVRMLCAKLGVRPDAV